MTKLPYLDDYLLTDHAHAEMQRRGLAITQVEAMRVTFDARTDTMTIILNDNPVIESDEEMPGIIIDYDKDGNIVALEILDASTRVVQPKQMVYELAG